MDVVEGLRQRNSVPHCMPNKDKGCTKVACDSLEILAVGVVWRHHQEKNWVRWGGAVGMESRSPPSAEFPAGF